MPALHILQQHTTLRPATALHNTILHHRRMPRRNNMRHHRHKEVHRNNMRQLHTAAAVRHAVAVAANLMLAAVAAKRVAIGKIIK